MVQKILSLKNVIKKKNSKDNVNIIYGDWIDIIPTLNKKFDGIFMDTYEDKNYSKFEDYDFGVQKFDRIISNNPTNCLPFLERAMALVVENGMIHFYSICPKDGSFSLSEHLAEGFECIAKKEVHAYSPSSSLFVFDIRRNLI